MEKAFCTFLLDITVCKRSNKTLEETEKDILYNFYITVYQLPKIIIKIAVVVWLCFLLHTFYRTLIAGRSGSLFLSDRSSQGGLAPCAGARRHLEISFVRRERLGELARGQSSLALLQYEMIQQIQIFRFQLREHRRRVRAGVLVPVRAFLRVTPCRKHFRLNCSFRDPPPGPREAQNQHGG